jgi:hypothetical protein
MTAIEIFYYPMRPFLAVPWLALAPALALLGLWLARARGTSASVAVLVAGLLWLVYAAWEISFLFRAVREWIRIDLLLIWPILLIASVWALMAFARRRQQLT